MWPVRAPQMRGMIQKQLIPPPAAEQPPPLRIPVERRIRDPVLSQEVRHRLPAVGEALGLIEGEDTRTALFRQHIDLAVSPPENERIGEMPRPDQCGTRDGPPPCRSLKARPDDVAATGIMIVLLAEQVHGPFLADQEGIGEKAIRLDGPGMERARATDPRREAPLAGMDKRLAEDVAGAAESSRQGKVRPGQPRRNPVPLRATVAGRQIAPQHKRIKRPEDQLGQAGLAAMAQFAQSAPLRQGDTGIRQHLRRTLPALKFRNRQPGHFPHEQLRVKPLPLLAIQNRQPASGPDGGMRPRPPL